MVAKKRTAKRWASTDALLKESLVAALRRDAQAEVKQIHLLQQNLVELRGMNDELASIRIILEQSKASTPRKRKAVK
jgi:hypothetical protein